MYKWTSESFSFQNLESKCIPSIYSEAIGSTHSMPSKDWPYQPITCEITEGDHRAISEYSLVKSLKLLWNILGRREASKFLISFDSFYRIRLDKTKVVYSVYTVGSLKLEMHWESFWSLEHRQKCSSACFRAPPVRMPNRYQLNQKER